jgi:FkbM family methyltransferase
LASLKAVIKRLLPSKVLGWVRANKLKQHISDYPARVIEQKYCGYDLKVSLEDGMAESWYGGGFTRLAEVELLQKGKLREGATVFDIGAHQCVVALVLANIVGPQGKVVALEANSHNARVATKNRDLNGAKQLEVLHAAGSDTPGHITFNEGLNGHVDRGGGEWGQVRVEAVTIDGLAEKYGTPDVLFVDVEGFECAVLRGATETLKKLPDCFVEVHTGEGLEEFGGSVADVLAFFTNKPYNLYMMPAEHEHDPRPFDPNAKTAQERFLLIAMADK